MVVISSESPLLHEFLGGLSDYDVELRHGFPPHALVLFHECLLSFIAEMLVIRADLEQDKLWRHTVVIQLVPFIQQLNIVL